MALVVLKFGGSSVGDEKSFNNPEHLPKIINTVKAERVAGNKVVVVISAMAGETRRLKQMAMDVATINKHPEDDVIMAAGEQVAAGLLAKGLTADNCKARSFLGWQIPIITDRANGEAKILRVETTGLHSAISSGIVPVVAGFQGITENQEITTLGFDGSDTTAVAIAKAIDADYCRFYKDVCGVYTANPRRVPLAKKLDKISAKQMHILASLGARILHPQAIEKVVGSKLKLHIVPNFTTNETGTIISEKEFDEDLTGITYYQYPDKSITLSVVGKSISNKKDQDKVIYALNQKKIFAEIITTEHDYMSVTASIGWVEQLDTALQALHKTFGLDLLTTPNKPAFLGDGKQVYMDPALG